MKLVLTALSITLLFSGAASAQMSVTTFGATNAQACYDDARNGLTKETSSCDDALRHDALSNRDRISTFVNRGIILNRAGRLQDALSDFDQALLDDPDLAEAYLNRGNTYFLMSSPDAAIADYEAALNNGLKKDHVAWYNIGLAHEAKKDFAKAGDAYNRSLELNPNFGLARDKLANLESKK